MEEADGTEEAEGERPCGVGMKAPPVLEKARKGFPPPEVPRPTPHPPPRTSPLTPSTQ